MNATTSTNSKGTSQPPIKGTDIAARRDARDADTTAPPTEAAAKPKRKSTYKPKNAGDRIVVTPEIVAQLDGYAAALMTRFGFKPTPSQTISYLISKADKAKPDDKPEPFAAATTGTTPT